MKDLIIIGAGPAGLSASIYASRYKMDHCIIASEVGGQVNEAWEIENYPGTASISGKELMIKFREHAEKLGTEIVTGEVQQVVKKEDGFSLLFSGGKTIETRMLILSLGMKPRRMNLAKENELIGKGVSYCATCDAMFFRGKDVAVIGGGDSAATAALHLTEFANNVKLLFKTGTKKFLPAWEEKIIANPKINIEEVDEVLGIIGENVVQGLSYKKDGEEKEIVLQGVFIEVGTIPLDILTSQLGISTDEQGYIIVGNDQSTNIEDVYAAGDVTTGSNKFRQIITAASEGAIAAGSAYKKLKVTKK